MSLLKVVKETHITAEREAGAIARDIERNKTLLA
jgi:hypothetical protein